MADTARGRGKGAARTAKRRAIADGTWRVFLREGLGGTTARAIAAETGGSVGSLYTYYPSTDSVVRELVLKSLGQLAREVAISAAAKTGARDRIAAAVETIAGFYAPGSRGAELLPMVLRNATGEEDEEGAKFDSRVNGKLIAALVPVAEAFQSAGLGQEAARAKALGLGCFVLGLVMLESSGRFQALQVTGESIIRAYLAESLPPRGRPAKPPAVQ